MSTGNERATIPMNAINIPGMLKNMMKEGFSTFHCLSELIDDSQGASAKIIRIVMNSFLNLLIVSDDGKGMTRDKLESSHYFHSRSSASSKHGRFGIGRKHALVHFTSLKGPALTISRSSENNALSQLNIDFPKVLASGNLYLYSHGIEEESRPIWDKYAVNPHGNGTLTHLNCDKNVLTEIIQRATSDNVVNSLRYFLASTYNNYLKAGGQIILDIDGETISIQSIDRLCWDTVSEKDETILSILYNQATKEVRPYFTDKYTKAKKHGYLTIPTGRKKHCFMTDPPTDDFVTLGKVSVRCAYSDDWSKLQKEVLTNMGVNVPEDHEDGVEELRRFLGGLDIERNGKLIAMIQAEKAKSGDKARYTYVENSRYSIKFNPVQEDNLPENDDVFTLDDVFNVQVNKSRIDTSLIDSNVWATIEKIRRSYASYCYERLCPSDKEEVVEEAVEEVETKPHENTIISFFVNQEPIHVEHTETLEPEHVEPEHVEPLKHVEPPSYVEMPKDVEPLKHVESPKLVIESMHVELPKHVEPPKNVEPPNHVEPPKHVEPLKHVESPNHVQLPKHVEPLKHVESPKLVIEPTHVEPPKLVIEPTHVEPKQVIEHTNVETPMQKQPEQVELLEQVYETQEKQEQKQKQKQEQEQEQDKEVDLLQISTFQEPSNAVVEVAPHQRELPKSPKDLLIQLRKMLSSYTDLDAIIAKASNVVEPGITAKCRTLHEIEEYIMKLKG